MPIQVSDCAVPPAVFKEQEKRQAALQAQIDALEARRAAGEDVAAELDKLTEAKASLAKQVKVSRKLRLDNRVIDLRTRANNGWWLYEFINSHPVDAPPLVIDAPVKPPVPTFAVWSARDGVVAPAAARGLPAESDRQVEVQARHLSLARSPATIAQIGDLLAEPI